MQKKSRHGACQPAFKSFPQVVKEWDTCLICMTHEVYMTWIKYKVFATSIYCNTTSLHLNWTTFSTQTKLICLEGCREGPVFFWEILPCQFQTHGTHDSRKSLNFSRTAIWWTGILRWRFASIGSSTQLHRLRFSARSIKKPWSLVWSLTWAESRKAVGLKRRGFYYIDIWICISDHIYIHVSVYQYIFPLHGISGFTAFNRNPHIRPLYFAHQRQNLWMLLTCLQHYPKLSIPPFQAASMFCLLLQHQKQSSCTYR